MSIELIKHLQSVLEDIHQQGLFKPERPLESPQGPSVHAQNWDEDLINLCANNYLGLANHPVMLAAAHEGLDSHGFGMASVRFICGTQDIHKALERKVADFVGMDDSTTLRLSTAYGCARRSDCATPTTTWLISRRN
jgi:glycine C-acetyltransferase